MTPEKPDANMTYVIREQEHCSAGIFTLDADIKLESDTFYAYYPRTANDWTKRNYLWYFRPYRPIKRTPSPPTPTLP